MIEKRVDEIEEGEHIRMIGGVDLGFPDAFGEVIRIQRLDLNRWFTVVYPPNTMPSPFPVDLPVLADNENVEVLA